MGHDDTTTPELAAADARYSSWRDAEAHAQQARARFDQALAAANDAGTSLRDLGERFGWHYSSVRDRIVAARDRDGQAVRS